jgi:predicted HD phosphohydrolase
VYFGDESPPISAYCQEYGHREQEDWFDDASHYNDRAVWVLLQEYPNLERVTLKHAEYLKRYDTNSNNKYWKALPQEALI